MAQKFITTMERMASLETDVRNFRGESSGRFDGIEKQVDDRFNAVMQVINDLRDNHIHSLQERVDSYQKLLYGATLAALGNIVVSFIIK